MNFSANIQRCILSRATTPCNAATHRLSNSSGSSPLQRVLGCSHRLPGDIASDDHYLPDAIPGTESGDTGMGLTRRVRESALQAYDLVTIRERVDDSIRARSRVSTPLRADDPGMVWNTKHTQKQGTWAGPVLHIGTHHGSVWVSLHGSLWACSALQCNLLEPFHQRSLFL